MIYLYLKEIELIFNKTIIDLYALSKILIKLSGATYSQN
jgi:hypothetical protein